MRLATRFGFLLRDIIYPGLDLHTRNRASLRRFWRSGRRFVLDAGSGNGFQSWLAYRSGANVVGFTFDEGQVLKSSRYLIGHRRADPNRLRFEQRNLYSLPEVSDNFDEIICYETLEHIRNDSLVVREFYRLLNPGGVVHICCPNREHPRHKRELLDEAETGGHVRAGYTVDELAQLLKSAGFEVDAIAGVGSRWLYLTDAVVRYVRNKCGDIIALPLLPFALPLVWLDSPNPRLPFSIYCRGVKRVDADIKQG